MQQIMKWCLCMLDYWTQLVTIVFTDHDLKICYISYNQQKCIFCQNHNKARCISQWQPSSSDACNEGINYVKMRKILIKLFPATDHEMFLHVRLLNSQLVTIFCTDHDFKIYYISYNNRNISQDSSWLPLWPDGVFKLWHE